MSWSKTCKTKKNITEGVRFSSSSPVERAELLRRLPGHVAHAAQEGGRQQAGFHHRVVGRRADEAAQDVLYILALGVGGQRGLDL